MKNKLKIDKQRWARMGSQLTMSQRITGLEQTLQLELLTRTPNRGGESK